MNAIAALLLLAPPASLQDPTPPAPAPASASRIRIEARVEPFLDLWFAVRAAGSAATDVSEFLASAVQLFRALDEDLQSPLAWAPIEGRLAQCRNAAEARAAFEALPEKHDRRGGAPIALRERALELADALAVVETAFREQLWPANEALIRAALAELETGLIQRADEVFAAHATVLGFEGLDLAVPCVLVARMPAPGAVTHRGTGGRAVCFIGVDGLAGSVLAEVVLHEATHALDVARDDDLFDAFRKRLEAAGVERGSKVWRDAPHTLMFCASASTVRRVLAPEHVDYGETSGFYARVGAPADAVRKAWSAIEAQATSRDGAADALTAAVVLAVIGKSPEKPSSDGQGAPLRSGQPWTSSSSHRTHPSTPCASSTP